MNENELNQHARWQLTAVMRARLDNRVRFRSREMTRRFRASRLVAAIAPQTALDNPRIILGTD